MQISLTTFADFVVASPTGRLARVKDALRQEGSEYDPAQDYWRPLRRAIVSAHRSEQGRPAIEAFVVSDTRKAANYAAGVTAYLKWLGRRDLAWVGGRSQPWTSGDLTIQVNPELYVAIGDMPHAIKLWFRKDKLAKQQADPLLHLLTETHGGDNCAVGILDVHRGRLLKPNRTSARMAAVLEGEAAAFVAMWRRLRETSAVTAAG